MQMWEVLVPYKMGKKNVQVPYHREWDAKVVAITGGLTICKPTKGTWVSPTGKTHRELMIPVRIACTEEQIKKIITMTLEHYEQEAVLAYRVSDEVIFYSRENFSDTT
jgi:hypothetical protein